MTGPGPRPKLKLAVLACMDARLEPHSLLGLERGDAHVIRNAGGLVTDDALRSLSISQRLLGTEEIVVVMHRDCGMEGASEPGAFEDVEEELRRGLDRLRNSPELPIRDRISGLIYDPADGSLKKTH